MRNIARTQRFEDMEPTAAELAAIEAEWPQIEADLCALDTEITALLVGDRASELARYREHQTAQRGLATTLTVPAAARTSKAAA